MESVFWILYKGRENVSAKQYYLHLLFLLKIPLKTKKKCTETQNHAEPWCVEEISDFVDAQSSVTHRRMKHVSMTPSACETCMEKVMSGCPFA
jgi:hypothetical protein